MFLFLGYKFYKEWVIVFIPLLIVVLGFYLYLTYVEKSVNHNSKFTYIIIILFSIVIAACLMVIFTNFIYFLLTLLVSFRIGKMVFSYLIKDGYNLEYYYEYAIIAVVFLVFLILFYTIKNYFVVFSTAILGSTLIMISLHYLGVSNFDFLFELELSEFKDIQKLEPEFINMMIIFVLVTCIGSFT